MLIEKMSNKQMPSQELSGAHIDAIRVKISECYKPPPKINLLTTYSQRLSLNSDILHNLPKYEFTLEEAALEKMKVWKAVRRATVSNRIKKLEEIQQIKEKSVDSESSHTDISIEVTSMDNIEQDPSSTNTFYKTFFPTKLANIYSNILTPIPLCPSTNLNTRIIDRSPVNISEFEADTSSPFDNMALKSINEMEELAKVLKINDGYSNISSQDRLSNNYQGTINLNQTSFSSYNHEAKNYINVPNSALNREHVDPSSYSFKDGYFIANTNVSSPYVGPYQYYNSMDPTTSTFLDNSSSLERKKSNCQSVPDITKSFENESEAHSDISIELNIPVTRPKSAEAIYVSVNLEDDTLENPFEQLPRNLQELSTSISKMGFPLSRVARTCKVLGNDDKKVVEHLLVMTELLDLGFTEERVAEALFSCGNDREKALDKLIS